MKHTSEAAFETAIEQQLLSHGYVRHVSSDFEPDLAIFREPALAFVQTTQPKVWDKLAGLHGDKTGERVISALFMQLQIEEKRTEEGKKVKKETMIFPRYHQLQAVRDLVRAVATEGTGHNYMNDPEFKALVSEWLGQQVYSKIPKAPPYRKGST